MTLTTINAKADNINKARLKRIDEPELIYEAKLEGDFGERENQLPAPRTLELKVGAQVMFLKNHANWVNGTVGKILELSEESARVAIESAHLRAKLLSKRKPGSASNTPGTTTYKESRLKP